MTFNINELGTSKFEWWVGVVEDRDDPLMLGRIRVRIFNLHGDIGSPASILTEDLPWAVPIMPVNSSSTAGTTYLGDNGIGISPTGILVGSTVVGFFADGAEKQLPIVFGTLPGAPLGIEDNPATTLTDVPYEAKGIKASQDVRVGNIEPEYALLGASGGSKYPYNKVTVTESGHLMEYDDSPGNERIFIRHFIGSYMHMHNNGDVVNKVIGSHWEIIAGNKISNVVGGNYFIILDEGNMVIQAKGNIQLAAGENIQLAAGKNIAIQAGGTVAVVGRPINLN